MSPTLAAAARDSDNVIITRRTSRVVAVALPGRVRRRPFQATHGVTQRRRRVLVGGDQSTVVGRRPPRRRVVGAAPDARQVLVKDAVVVVVDVVDQVDREKRREAGVTCCVP